MCACVCVIEKLILKYAWKSMTTKIILNKKNRSGGLTGPYFKNYYKVIVIKPEWNWYKDRHIWMKEIRYSKKLTHTWRHLMSKKGWTSMLAQWLRTRLPKQGTWVWSLVQEDPTGRGATKPVRHNYWAWALEPISHNYWVLGPKLLKLTYPRAWVPQLLSPHAATTGAHTPRACASQ